MDNISGKSWTLDWPGFVKRQKPKPLLWMVWHAAAAGGPVTPMQQKWFVMPLQNGLSCRCRMVRHAAAEWPVMPLQNGPLCRCSMIRHAAAEWPVTRPSRLGAA